MWMFTQSENRDPNVRQKLEDPLNVDVKNDKISEDELLTKDEELNKKGSMEGPALLETSFRSNRTDKTQEGGAQTSEKPLDEVAEKPPDEETSRRNSSLKKSKKTSERRPTFVTF